MVDISLEDGIKLIKDNLKPNISTRVVGIDKALDEIVAKDIVALYNNPPFNRSPVDGYACISKDLTFANNDEPVNLKVIGELCAGDDKIFEVNSGECIRIMTGAEIPKNCDCCVKQEDTNYGEVNVEIYSSCKKHNNFCFEGEDYLKGTTLIKAGEKISYIEIGILASSGIFEIEVLKKPKIAILSTGDEVIMPYEPLTKAKIFNSNIFMLEARLNNLGFNDIYKEHITDEPIEIYNKIVSLYKNYDIVITTGGVSVGKKDVIHSVVGYENINQIFWKLKIQPGTPIMFSMYKEMPVISLSGNPFASLVNFELVVREILYLYYNDKKLKINKTKGVLENSFNKKSTKRRFLRAEFENGKVYFKQNKHSSGVLSSLSGCNVLVEVQPNTNELKIGDRVTVLEL